MNNNFKSLVPILVDTIQNVDEGYFGEDDDGTGLVPIEIKLRSPVMNLLYEYSRSQILSNNDLSGLFSLKWLKFWLTAFV